MPQLIVVVEVPFGHLLDPTLNASFSSDPTAHHLGTHRCRLSLSLLSWLNRFALHSSLDGLPLVGGSLTPSARDRYGGGFVSASSSFFASASSGVRCDLDVDAVGVVGGAECDAAGGAGGEEDEDEDWKRRGAS